MEPTRRLSRSVLPTRYEPTLTYSSSSTPTTMVLSRRCAPASIIGASGACRINSLGQNQARSLKSCPLRHSRMCTYNHWKGRNWCCHSGCRISNASTSRSQVATSLPKYQKPSTELVVGHHQSRPGPQQVGRNPRGGCLGRSFLLPTSLP